MTEDRYKRYLVFSFPEYYPAGGLGDCIKDFDSLNEAFSHDFDHLSDDSSYIFDRLTGSVIETVAKDNRLILYEGPI